MSEPSAASRRAFDEAFARLAALTDYETMATVPYHERTYGLARAEGLLADLGAPAAGLPTVQVVGSKGKGTCAHAAAALLRAAGLRTGLYTSPHLVHPSERILLDGKPVAGEEFAAGVERVLPLALGRAGGDRPTFFELMTALALFLFQRGGAQAVVLEAGMGGRLDATTAARRDGVLLTGVDLEHTAALGRTRVRIAREKAAAARRGVPLWSAEPADTPAGRAVAETCRAAGAPLRTRGRAWQVLHASTGLDAGGPWTTFDLRMRGGGTLRDLRLPLLGVHQALNGGLAAAALLELGGRGGFPCLDEGTVRRGLAATRVPARLEVISRDPVVVLDGAHTPGSVRAARVALRAALPRLRGLVVVLAVNRDKDLTGILRALRGVRLVVATETPNPRRTARRALAAAARAEGLEATSAADPAAALDRARAALRPGEALLVTGSLYLAGALRPSLLEQPPAPPAHAP